ncbi:hypothetical protein VNO78_25798 [Psophocarpus tetragonolobus]|uniref:Uncharacterized protein n=1 Tax=Psophocarpus tetragonolobus TaxID=3891 RepID=A0AAN9S8F1_PSOTE
MVPTECLQYNLKGDKSRAKRKAPRKKLLELVEVAQIVQYDVNEGVLMDATRAKRKAPRKKLLELAESESHKNCGHRHKIGAFMGQAREVCTLPFLTEASTICYGVLTGI